MTVDASRSCLGLGTCVGPGARQIVDARVLLTAAAPPVLPSSSMSAGWLAPPLDAITRSPRSARGRRHAAGNSQMKPVSSRAIAAVTTLIGLPVRASLR
jgi:hypothetical protein